MSILDKHTESPAAESSASESSARFGDLAPGLIDEIANWLMAQALNETEFESLFGGFCERALAAGIPLWRSHIAYSTLHPLYSGMGMTWRRRSGVTIESYAHGGEQQSQFQQSPLFQLIQSQIPFLRRRLTGSEALLDYPFLVELCEQGATDYLAFRIPFGDGDLDGMVGSWATDRPLGFSERDVKALLRLQQRLGVACKMRIKNQIAESVVTAYLGADAGLRVLNGQIRLGQGDTVRAAILYSDLRESTRLSEQLSRDDYIRALNDYFECSAGSVMENGGEILNLIGDAVLAIFVIGENSENSESGEQVCERALAAARGARQRLFDVNQRRGRDGAELLDFGVALHFGEVMLGNIGIPDRLSFSAIGPTVNEVARLEALTKELGQPILASETFANQLPEQWLQLSRHALRGVGATMQIYAAEARPTRKRRRPSERPPTRAARGN